MRLNVYVEWAEKNASAYIAEIQGFIITAKTVKALQAEIEDALNFHAEGCLNYGIKADWLNDRNWQFVYHYSISALLNLYDGALNQSSFARITGINASLMRQYLCGNRNPSRKQLIKIEKKLHTFASSLTDVNIV
jgi:predicted RNase H-like HicB family nuclease